MHPEMDWVMYQYENKSLELRPMAVKITMQDQGTLNLRYLSFYSWD